MPPGTSNGEGLNPEFAYNAELAAVLLDDRPPFDVDWQTSAFELSETERLFRLARVKAILPEDNAKKEKATHDKTIENYIRLALQAAGSRDTLRTFLDHVYATLNTNPEDGKLLAQQVSWVWAPAAEVAGLHHYKTVLDDLALRTLRPQDYARIQQEYDYESLAAEGGILDRMKEDIELLLEATLRDEVSYELTARPKSIYSIWQKEQDENRQNPDLYDVVGFRVIIEGEENIAVQQCYAAAAAVAEAFKPERSRQKDYIAQPKPNGYQSLHLTLYTPAGLPFELQVRTLAMHIAAEADAMTSHQTYDAAFKEALGKIKKVYRKVPKFLRWRDAATQFIKLNNGSCEGIVGGEILFFRLDGNL